MSSQSNTALHPYLSFPGTCREAMTFYKDCLGGELEIMTFEGSPIEIPPGAENNVLHCILTRPGIVLMASDTMPGDRHVNGTNVSLSLNCESRSQADEFFGKLGTGGTVTMPMQNTFWGAYFGMVTDKYGTHWMFNYDKPRN